MNKEKKLQITHHQCTDIGSLPIVLSTITVGKGSPKTLVVSGLHGSERTGQLVIHNILRNLPDFEGTLTILPIANPLGFAMNQRTEPVSHKNMNREFPGKTYGEPVSLLVSKVFEIAQEHDYVFDLHCFETAGMVEGLLMTIDDKKVTQKSLDMLNLFNPEIIWVIDATQKEQTKYAGTLSMNLAKQGIPSVVVETPKLEKATSASVEIAATGIIHHLVQAPNFGNTKSWHNLENKYFITKKELRSLGTGIFERNINLKLGDIVTKGQPVGVFYPIPEYDPQPVISEYEGVIFEMENEPQDVVTTGEVLLGIGLLLDTNKILSNT